MFEQLLKKRWLKIYLENLEYDMRFEKGDIKIGGYEMEWRLKIRIIDPEYIYEEYEQVSESDFERFQRLNT